MVRQKPSHPPERQGCDAERHDGAGDSNHLRPGRPFFLLARHARLELEGEDGGHHLFGGFETLDGRRPAGFEHDLVELNQLTVLQAGAQVRRQLRVFKPVQPRADS